MSRASLFGVLCLGVYMAASFAATSAYARPNYNNEFKATYGSNAAAVEAKCGVCHGAEKKIRNAYGMAVGAALGEPKVTDAAKIKAALETAAGKPSAVAGKTFGDLLKEGKLPASN